MKNVEFRETIYSPLLTPLPAEVNLIKKYPHIFLSFYHIKSNSVDPETLHKTCILFALLIRHLPLTTSLLLKFLSISPFQLGQKIISFFETARIDWFSRPDKASTFYACFNTFKNFIRKNSNPPIKDAFLKEALLWERGLA